MIGLLLVSPVHDQFPGLLFPHSVLFLFLSLCIPAFISRIPLIASVSPFLY
jgi:hypothetical protein